MMAQEPAGEAEVLRVAIQGGGCSGFEYALGFDRGARRATTSSSSTASRSSSTRSARRTCKGATVDFLETLQESGFKIDNPNVASACGCGSSFQVAEGEAPDAAAGCGTCAH